MGSNFHKAILIRNSQVFYLFLDLMLQKDLSDFILFMFPTRVPSLIPIRFYEVFNQNCPLSSWLPKFLLSVMAVFIRPFIHF